jgi:adenylate cyclase
MPMIRDGRQPRNDSALSREALKALELDNSLADPHATLGVVKRDFEWDWSGADEEFQRAIELNPGYVEAYHWRGTLFSMLGGHEEALREKTEGTGN